MECYRHPGRETNVSCSSCGNPICPDCMTPSPVGMRCPECAADRQTVIRPTDGVTAAGFVRQQPLTAFLLAVNTLIFLLEVATGYPLTFFPENTAGWVAEHGVFFGPLVADGEWWRLFTAGFLHFGLLHILMNMYLLYVLGQMLEPAIGTLRYGLVYVTSLLAGSLGAMILEPSTPSAGASGAIFGLMGLAFIVARARGIDWAVGQIGGLILINLLLTFSFTGISKGGHLGGLIGGVLCGLVLFELDERRGIFGRQGKWVGAGIVAAIGAGCVIAAIVLAQNKYGALLDQLS